MYVDIIKNIIALCNNDLNFRGSIVVNTLVPQLRASGCFTLAIQK